jgi:hypothetical protein
LLSPDAPPANKGNAPALSGGPPSRLPGGRTEDEHEGVPQAHRPRCCRLLRVRRRRVRGARVSGWIGHRRRVASLVRALVPFQDVRCSHADAPDDGRRATSRSPTSSATCSPHATMLVSLTAVSVVAEVSRRACGRRSVTIPASDWETLDARRQGERPALHRRNVRRLRVGNGAALSIGGRIRQSSRALADLRRYYTSKTLRVHSRESNGLKGRCAASGEAYAETTGRSARRPNKLDLQREALGSVRLLPRAKPPWGKAVP